MNLSHRIKLLAGPGTALCILLFADLDPAHPLVTRMAAVAVWMAVWWLTEAVHLAVTALIPVVFMPLLGIAPAGDVAMQYMDQIIFLFIGGFIISFAIEKWGLHERIALGILKTVGTSNDRILLGVMLTAYLISMWISNTATVMMLFSAVLAIVTMTEQAANKTPAQHGFSRALLIGLAYSATIGGMATLVGTPPNMVFLRSYQAAYPNQNNMNFAAWFSVGFPVSLLLLAVCFFVLRFLFIREQKTEGLTPEYFAGAYRRLGPFNYEQKMVTFLFATTAILWFTRADIDFGSFILPGWSNLFGMPTYIQDGTVAIFMAFLLFLVPSKQRSGTALLQWPDVTKLPFDIILLFGSGFALAEGFNVSGLSDWLAGHLQMFKGMNPVFLVGGISLIVCFISEFASNVACIQLVLPILIAFQKDLDTHPLMLMVPATLAASLGFMLPVATAPNTIVFGSRKIRVGDMARAGLLMDLAGVIIITLVISIMR